MSQKETSTTDATSFIYYILYIFFKSTADSLLKRGTFTIFGRDRIGHTVHNQKAAQGMMRQNGVSDSIHVGKENVVRKHIFDER
ncbi:hypothetical protein [Megasphaera massiliensis]|uniref:hypothetical protein n=1 Tax=Megasphaera massiliensis TaxID=1232428 RepID=UPI0036F2AAA2